METLIEKYNKLQKQILNDFSDEQKSICINQTNTTSHFSEDLNWDILHHSIYVMEVGELAKKNFLKFGLGGASNKPEVGGRYLRLFGLLSAVFQQKLALENLLDIYQTEGREKISSNLNSSVVIDLCNKLGIGATYFRTNHEEAENQFHLYEISRSDLEVSKIKLLIRKYEFEHFDLMEDLKCFDKKVELTLLFILAEILKKSFNNQGQFYDQFRTLNNLKDELISSN